MLDISMGTTILNSVGFPWKELRCLCITLILRRSCSSQEIKLITAIWFFMAEILLGIYRYNTALMSLIVITFPTSICNWACI